MCQSFSPIHRNCPVYIFVSLGGGVFAGGAGVGWAATAVAPLLEDAVLGSACLGGGGAAGAGVLRGAAAAAPEEAPLEVP